MPCCPGFLQEKLLLAQPSKGRITPALTAEAAVSASSAPAQATSRSSCSQIENFLPTQRESLSSQRHTEERGISSSTHCSQPPPQQVSRTNCTNAEVSCYLKVLVTFISVLTLSLLPLFLQVGEEGKRRRIPVALGENQKEKKKKKARKLHFSHCLPQSLSSVCLLHLTDGTQL